MSGQSEAVLKLLSDDDPTTVALVKAKLAEQGASGLAHLRDLLSAADAMAAFHLQDVIAEIEENQADDIFARLCAEFGEHGDLETAAWRLAATFDAGDDFAQQRGLLDDWGAELKRRLAKAVTKLDRVETLAEYLNHDLRIRGNEANYYDFENSLLPNVIESRLGIPISLTLVYMLVAARAGMQVDGVGLPGHFLARHEDIFFDPFHGGRRVGLDECKALLEQQNLVLQPEHLAPATPRQMLIRMLTNLYYIAEQTDPPLGAKLSGWIEALRS